MNMPNTSDQQVGPRVLIVEDEGLIAEELRERLSRLGMTVVGTVDTADAAVGLAIDTRPDVVLMDIQIKGARDGVQAAGDIRREVDVPVVYLTAHSDSATLERAKDSGPFGYLLKPFQEREVVIAIEIAIHRHSLERQLKESERKYVATLASIGDAVVASDLYGHITFMNPVAEALTGWRFADARGLSADLVFRVARDSYGVAPVRPIAQALESGKPVRFDDAELFLFSKTHEVIPVDDCAAPIVDDRGRVIGGVVAFRDIRSRRLAEDALRQAQEELFQSQKMESVGRLAAGIAHDFNNLLTVINGCSELALENPGLDETTHALLEDVLRAGGRAASLTRQFLIFGRKQVLQSRILDLTTLVTELAAMLRRLIGEDVDLTVTPDPSPISVFADPSQIEQIIVNLAVNARDAMPEGGALTIVTSRATIEPGRSDGAIEPLPGPYALLTVTDTGHGIDEAVQAHIFEPYFTTKEIGKGSGLGLATVYGIVKQSGGFIELDSGRDRGTRFKVYLPLVDEAAQPRVPLEGPRVLERGKGTILLVEDDGLVRSLLASVLRGRGYTVVEAEDGDNALREVEQHHGPIDLIVTDVVMPGMRGPALVSRLAERNVRPRALYISGYTSEDSPVASDATFLQKPFTPAVLVSKVRELLEN
jgi:two-component system, cell cycle sensor histidine kinase and response regulator CckA